MCSVTACINFVAFMLLVIAFISFVAPVLLKIMFVRLVSCDAFVVHCINQM